MKLVDCADCGETKPHKARGVCNSCYCRRSYAGDVTVKAPAASEPVTTLPEIPGLTYRQLDYWTTKGYLRADSPNPGTGRRRQWPDDELAVARSMLRLLDAGLTVDAANRVARGEAELAPGVRVVMEAVQ